MQILCSIAGIVSLDYPKSGLRDIAKSGYSKIVVDISGIMEEKNTKSLADICRKENLEIKAGYLECIYPNIDEHAIKTAHSLGCKYLVTSLSKEDNSYPRPLPLNSAIREYYLELAKIAKKNDITILIKNQSWNVNGHYIRGLFSDECEVLSFIDELNNAVNEECFGFALDFGTCSLCGQNMYDFVINLKQRLKMVILRDCDGSRETSMLPFTSVYEYSSKTDWLNLIRGLRSIDFDSLLLMYFRDTAAAFSPIIRPSLIKLSKNIADYFEWQIGMEKLLKKYPSRVLFGAGNMCRAYMKCYGEKYPPLFTCDNNKKLWGIDFCGLKVEPPDKLKEIPKDCVIYICNIYYSEIEQQLRDMGLKNPIERFNDEYMPTFYFDRLDRGE